MTKREVILGIPKGIHLRVAGSIAKKANEFNCEIYISHNDMNVNAKSVMGVAVLGAMTGDKITVYANGSDENKAVLNLCSLIENDLENKSDDEIFNKYIVGASWMDNEGRLYIVRGFHQEWIDQNSNLLNGMNNVQDVIEKLDWINVMIYKDKTIEFHVSTLNNSVINRIDNFLKSTSSEWLSAHVFTTERDGQYVIINKEKFMENENNLKSLLEKNVIEIQYYN